MSTYLIQSDGRPLRDIEAKVQKYLPGVDARLFPVSDQRAVIRGHLLDVLAAEYTAPRERWLAILGIANIQPLTDEQTLVLLQGRDKAELPPLRSAVATKIKGVDWHLDSVNVQGAWNLLGGADSIAWGGTKVAHIDTGYTLHPAFGFPDATWVDVTNAQTNMPSPSSGESEFALSEIGDGRDNFSGFSGGHGTRIGATICGWDPKAKGGTFFGVAPKVPYLPLRITDTVVINHAQRQFAEALDFVVAGGHAQVVNVSMGIVLGTVLPQLRKSLDRAYEAGVIVVCAAGNYVDHVVAPAKLPRTVAVAGVTSNLQPWSGSSFGSQVDFSAPAADLRRADVNRKLSFSYSTGGDGTSYATAITSGAAALWLTHRRNELAAAYSEKWCVVEAFVSLARQTAYIPSGVIWLPDAGFGSGILNIEALLAAPLPLQSALKQEPKA